MGIKMRVLNGKYKLKDEFGSPVPPEFFLGLFKDKPFYSDVRKFVRRVDNDTGIPFLTREEYKTAKKILPEEALDYYEGRVASLKDEIVYLRGKNYYLNLRERDRKNQTSQAEFALELLTENMAIDLKLLPIIGETSEKSRSLEEKMIAASLIDLYKNHLMVVFTGLYESMKLDKTIEVAYYNMVRREVEAIIDDYYRLIIEGRMPHKFMSQDNLNEVLEVIKKVIIKTGNVYENKRYLAREFDHPGRMVLYASHLLSQINEKGKKYDLLVNILNSSAEIGLATQTIDSLLGINRIRSTIIFEVDFARYSMKDREDKDISTYAEFENMAIPEQLRPMFRQKIKDKDTLIVDDNLNTGQTLYNVRTALKEIARSVDISVVEIVPILRVIGLIKEKNPEADPHNEIKLVESSLTYPPIGWWRDQRILNKDKVIQNILGFE